MGCAPSAVAASDEDGAKDLPERKAVSAEKVRSSAGQVKSVSPTALNGTTNRAPALNSARDQKDKISSRSDSGRRPSSSLKNSANSNRRGKHTNSTTSPVPHEEPSLPGQVTCEDLHDSNQQPLLAIEQEMSVTNGIGRPISSKVMSIKSLMASPVHSPSGGEECPKGETNETTKSKESTPNKVSTQLTSSSDIVDDDVQIASPAKVVEVHDVPENTAPAEIHNEEMNTNNSDESKDDSSDINPSIQNISESVGHAISGETESIRTEEPKEINPQISLESEETSDSNSTQRTAVYLSKESLRCSTDGIEEDNQTTASETFTDENHKSPNKTEQDKEPESSFDDPENEHSPDNSELKGKDILARIEESEIQDGGAPANSEDVATASNDIAHSDRKVESEIDATEADNQLNATAQDSSAEQNANQDTENGADVEKSTDIAQSTNHQQEELANVSETQDASANMLETVQTTSGETAETLQNKPSPKFAAGSANAMDSKENPHRRNSLDSNEGDNTCEHQTRQVTLSKTSIVTNRSLGSLAVSISDLLSDTDFLSDEAECDLSTSAAALLAFPNRSSTAKYRKAHVLDKVDDTETENSGIQTEERSDKEGVNVNTHIPSVDDIKNDVGTENISNSKSLSESKMNEAEVNVDSDMELEIASDLPEFVEKEVKVINNDNLDSITNKKENIKIEETSNADIGFTDKSQLILCEDNCDNSATFSPLGDSAPETSQGWVYRVDSPLKDFKDGDNASPGVSITYLSQDESSLPSSIEAHFPCPRIDLASETSDSFSEETAQSHDDLLRTDVDFDVCHETIHEQYTDEEAEAHSSKWSFKLKLDSSHEKNVESSSDKDKKMTENDQTSNEATDGKNKIIETMPTPNEDASDVKKTDLSNGPISFKVPETTAIVHTDQKQDSEELSTKKDSLNSQPTGPTADSDVKSVIKNETEPLSAFVNSVSEDVTRVDSSAAAAPNTGDLHTETSPEEFNSENDRWKTVKVRFKEITSAEGTRAENSKSYDLTDDDAFRSTSEKLDSEENQMEDRECEANCTEESICEVSASASSSESDKETETKVNAENFEDGKGTDTALENSSDTMNITVVDNAENVTSEEESIVKEPRDAEDKDSTNSNIDQDGTKEEVSIHNEDDRNSTNSNIIQSEGTKDKVSIHNEDDRNSTSSNIDQEGTQKAVTLQKDIATEADSDTEDLEQRSAKITDGHKSPILIANEDRIRTAATEADRVSIKNQINNLLAQQYRSSRSSSPVCLTSSSPATSLSTPAAAVVHTTVKGMS